MKTAFHLGIAALALLMGLTTISCRRPPPSRAGVAITFDDHSIEEWHRALDLFRRYNAHATFFVDQFHLLTEEQLRLLEDIRQDGHEIGVHSVDHVNAHVFLAEQSGRTMEDYAREQVLPAVEAMRRYGFAPVSFSYPGGHGPPEGDAVLLRHFRMLRTNNHYAPFHAFDGARVAGAQGIDHQFATDRKKIFSRLDEARREDKVLVLFGHRIGPERGLYYTAMDDLEVLLQYARKQGLQFYRFGDLGPVPPGRIE